jgi:hypothetical protein
MTPDEKIEFIFKLNNEIRTKQQIENDLFPDRQGIKTYNIHFRWNIYLQDSGIEYAHAIPRNLDEVIYPSITETDYNLLYGAGKSDFNGSGNSKVVAQKNIRDMIIRKMCLDYNFKYCYREPHRSGSNALHFLKEIKDETFNINLYTDEEIIINKDTRQIDLQKKLKVEEYVKKINCNIKHIEIIKSLITYTEIEIIIPTFIIYFPYICLFNTKYWRHTKYKRKEHYKSIDISDINSVSNQDAIMKQIEDETRNVTQERSKVTGIIKKINIYDSNGLNNIGDFTIFFKLFDLIEFTNTKIKGIICSSKEEIIKYKIHSPYIIYFYISPVNVLKNDIKKLFDELDIGDKEQIMKTQQYIKQTTQTNKKYMEYDRSFLKYYNHCIFNKQVKIEKTELNKLFKDNIIPKSYNISILEIMKGKHNINENTIIEELIKTIKEYCTFQSECSGYFMIKDALGSIGKNIYGFECFTNADYLNNKIYIQKLKEKLFSDCKIKDSESFNQQFMLQKKYVIQLYIESPTLNKILLDRNVYGNNKHSFIYTDIESKNPYNYGKYRYKIRLYLLLHYINDTFVSYIHTDFNYDLMKYKDLDSNTFYKGDDNTEQFFNSNHKDVIKLDLKIPEDDYEFIRISFDPKEKIREFIKKFNEQINEKKCMLNIDMDNSYGLYAIDAKFDISDNYNIKILEINSGGAVYRNRVMNDTYALIYNNMMGTTLPHNYISDTLDMESGYVDSF